MLTYLALPILLFTLQSESTVNERFVAPQNIIERLINQLDYADLDALLAAIYRTIRIWRYRTTRYWRLVIEVMIEVVHSGWPNALIFFGGSRKNSTSSSSLSVALTRFPVCSGSCILDNDAESAVAAAGWLCGALITRKSRSKRMKRTWTQ